MAALMARPPAPAAAPWGDFMRPWAGQRVTALLFLHDGDF